LRRLPEPDRPCLIREMRRPWVNLTLLWEEYRETHPEGYGYSRISRSLQGFRAPA